MRLDLSTRLSIPNLERALNAEHPYQMRGGWSSRLCREGLTVDLSRVEWVEPSALVMIVLLIEGCVRDGFDVVLIPPRRQPFDVEADIISTAQRTGSAELLKAAGYVHAQVRRRQAAFESLVRWRMWPALLADHILQAKGKVDLEEEPDASRQKETHVGKRDTPSSDVSADLSAELTYRQIFPLSWIGDPKSERDSSELARIGNYDMLSFLTYVLRLPDRGISTPDARTLAHVFLFELAENVGRHADVPYGLLAVWARPAFEGRRQFFEEAMRTTYRRSEQEFGRWASASPVVEVLVGDSGMGIPAVLGAEFDRSSVDVTQALGIPGDLGESLSKREQVMFWSLDKWSSSVFHGPERGTRGLYRVQRVVNKWEGSLTIRAETNLIGMNCKLGAQNRYFVERRRLARIPGTIVHLRLPAKHFPQPVVMSSPLRKHRFVITDLDPILDIDTAAEKAVCDVAQLSRVHGHSAVIIVDLGFRPLDRHQLEPMLSRLIQVAHPTAMVIANLGRPGWQSFLQLADSIEEDLLLVDSTRQGDMRHEASSTRNVVLVVDESGNARWIGHESWLCTLLDRLLRVEELQEEDILSEIPDALSRDQALRDLWEQSHVIDGTANGAFRLRFNLGDVVGQLSERMSLELQQRIESGEPPAVFRDRVFVTPSQRLVHSYIRADELLAGNLRRHAMGLLALRIKVHLRAAGEGDSIISVVTDEGKARGLASDLREHLGEAELHPVPAYSRVGRLLATMSVQPGHRVIVFADVVSTGSLVRSLLDRVIQNSLDPSLVACIVDARSTRSEYITLNGRRIPVISLTQVDLDADEHAKVSGKRVTISPVTGEPELAPASLGYELVPDRLDEMVIASNAWYFDHIRRSEWRHFTLYLDAWRLLARADLKAEILRAFRQVIDQWRQENKVNEIHRILYPRTSEEEHEPTAAEAIAHGLGAIYGLSRDQVGVIPRGHGTGEFIFGDTVRDPWGLVLDRAESGDSSRVMAGKNLVLLDWGCITGQTAYKMVSTAVSLEAKNALIAFFVSQIPSEKEADLRNLPQVAKNQNQTTVSVRFVTRCCTWAYGRNECPYCEQDRRFREEMAKFKPPAFLEEFVDEARMSLREKRLKDVRLQAENGPDVVSSAGESQLSLESPGAQFVRMARFRELLREAESRTSERVRVRDHILSLAGQSITSVTGGLPSKAELMKLVACEWPLFNRPPLQDREIREEVGKTAVEVALDQSTPEQTRQSAIIVLRTAYDSLFVRHFSEMLVSFLPNPALEKQLLYCGFTLLKAEDAEDEARLPRLADSLREAVDSVRAAIGNGYDQYRFEVLRTVNFMYDRARLLTRKMAGDQPAAPRAWQLLKLELGESYGGHHVMGRAVLALFQRALEEALQHGAANLPEVPWSDIAELWEAGEKSLREDVLGYLPPLKQTLGGKYAREILGVEAADILGDEDQLEMLGHVGVIRTSLESFAKDPEQVRSTDRWASFRYSRDCLWEYVFAYIRGNGGRSALLRFLDGCPFPLEKLHALVESMVQIIQWSIPPDVRFGAQLENESVKIFCHEGVVRRCLYELLENVTEHLPPQEKEKGGNVMIELSCSKAEHSVTITLRNDRTDPTINVGAQRGLAICRDYLAAYHASLESEWLQSGVHVVTMRFEEAY